jgi:RNA polymerase sigma-70 factor (ECF subfamily)
VTNSTDPTDEAVRDARPDPAWVREVLERHERPLVFYATRLLGDAEAARDVVQETLLRLCRADRAQVEPRLSAWLFAVCRNLALDAGKKERRMKSRLSRPGVPVRDMHDAGGTRSADPATRVERDEGAARVLRELETLPDNQREVLRLKFQNGFAYREIADVTGLSVGNVGFLLHTGLKTLRARLQPLEVEPLPNTGTRQ